MIVEKKMCVNLDQNEIDIINKFIELKDDFHNKNLCGYLMCSDCPMQKLCDNNISNAYEFQDMINES